MCGVAGVVRFVTVEAKVEDVSAELLCEMTDLIQHRGPDGQGVWNGPGVGLGHRRLSILDVVGSPQPMVSRGKRFVIVFNGEIVNYEFLRMSYNLTCDTTGDTEVLLKLLELRGVAVLAELRGQFAFAMYDTVDRSLLLARDRLGIIPLYYAHTPSAFVFASEPKALAPFLGPLEVNDERVAELLMFRTVSAPATPIRGVEKLLPGHWMRVEHDGSTTYGAYWGLTHGAPQGPYTGSAENAVDEFDCLLRASVQENLVADVPVGAYLSGGVDSSLIVAHAAAIHGPGLKTFSAAFDVGFDERPFARQVAKQFKTDHYEVVVSATDYFDELQRLTWFRDAPMSEPADVAVAALARLASQHVKVVLSGEGSDELFGGYQKYRFAKLSSLGARVPLSFRSRVLPLAQRVVGTKLGPGIQVLRAMEGSSEWIRHASWFASFTEQEVLRLTGKLHFAERDDIILRGDAIQRMGTVDMTTWLSDNLLERGDRMTMASSIELRPPFLDPRLVDFARSLPSSITNRNNVQKWPVRMAAKRYVDASLIDRPKTGFSVPLSEWFRGDLRERVNDLLTGADAKSSSLVDAREVSKILRSHEHGKVDAWRQIWALVTLELFCRQLANPTTDSHTQMANQGVHAHAGL